MQRRIIQRLLAVAGAVVLISNICSQQVMAAQFDIPGVDILQDQKREETPSEPEEEIPYVLPDLEGNGEGITEQQVVTFFGSGWFAFCGRSRKASRYVSRRF